MSDATRLQDAQPRLSAAGEQALAYARRGWHVFPCKANKQPHTEHGFCDATTDVDQIVAWWQRFPCAQVGVACGASRLVVVDLDRDKTKNGEESLRAHLGPTPVRCGLIASTPRGGRHLVYCDPDGLYGIGTEVANLRGVDVRGTGGYIVVPSPASPGRAWELGDWQSDDDLLPPPPDIAEILPPAYRGPKQPVGRGKMAEADPARDDDLEEARSALFAISPGKNRSTWLRAIWGFHAKVAADERGADIVEEWSSTTTVAGQYKRGEAYGTYATAVLPWRAPSNRRLVDKETLFHLAYEAGWKGGDDSETAFDFADAAEPAPPEVDVIPFPADLLDGDDLVAAIAQWMLASAPRRQPTFALASSLSVVAAVLGRRVQTETRLRTNVYVLCVGESGSGKEHGQACGSQILHEAHLHDLLGPSEFKSDSAVCSSLRAHPSRISFLDELGKYFGSINGQRAPAHLANISKQFLELFSKANRTVPPAGYADLKQHPPEPMHEPNLVLCGFTTPNTLYENLSSAQILDGLLGRMLMFGTEEQFPLRQRGDMCYPPPAELVERVGQLDSATKPGDLAGMTSDGTTASGCRTIRFSDEARIRWQAIGDEADQCVRRLTAKGSIAANLWKRRAEHVAKVALILALAGNEKAELIELDAVDRADRLVKWCLAGLHRDAARYIADSDHQRKVQRVQQIIDNADASGITQSALTKRTQWLRPQERKEVMHTLLEAGTVRQAQDDSTRIGGQGRATTRYYSTGGKER